MVGLVLAGCMFACMDADCYWGNWEEGETGEERKQRFISKLIGRLDFWASRPGGGENIGWDGW